MLCADTGKMWVCVSAGTLLARLCSPLSAAASLPDQLESDVSDHIERIFDDRDVEEQPSVIGVSAN